MIVTDTLIKEHHVIHKMLDSLECAKNCIENGTLPGKDFFQKAVRFSYDFVDRFHHFKEEFLMFGMLAQKKEGLLDLEIGSLRYQHEKCHGCVRKIESSLGGYDEKDEISVTTLIENLSIYISVLRRHIYLEDQIFFPMVEKMITEQEKKILADQFHKEESRMGGGKMFKSCKKISDEMGEMIQRYNVKGLN